MAPLKRPDRGRSRAHPLYRCWGGMRSRCRNPNHKRYSDYGGRGITVCSEWDDFWQFVDDMGPRPCGYTLDRKDNDGPYNKSNCKWSSPTEQCNNRRTSRYYTIEGRTGTVAELAAVYGVNPNTAAIRLWRGWALERAFQP